MNSPTAKEKAKQGHYQLILSVQGIGAGRRLLILDLTTAGKTHSRMLVDRGTAICAKCFSVANGYTALQANSLIFIEWFATISTEHKNPPKYKNIQRKSSNARLYLHYNPFKFECQSP
jgi:hypothetical protein